MRELPKDYFLGIDDELVDYLEEQGEETTREIHLSNKVNVENGYKLLNIQIVGTGPFFLLLTQETNFDFLTVGITISTLLWTWCAIYLVCTDLSVKVRSLINASPDHPYHEKYKDMESPSFKIFVDAGYLGLDKLLSFVRRYRLVDLSDAARELLLESEKIRTSLDKARMYTILAPVAAMFISAIFLHVQ